MEVCLKVGRILVLSVSSLFFIAFTAYLYWYADLPNYHDIALFVNLDILAQIMAYSFLTLFILLGVANIALLVSIRAKNKIQNHLTYQFKKEQRTLLIILFFFEMSYGFRFFIDSLVLTGWTCQNSFKVFLQYDIMCFCDGLSFLPLLLFHNKNFQSQTNLDEPSIE